MEKTKLPKPHYTLTFLAGFILFSIIGYYWPNGGLTIFNVIILSLIFTALGMLQMIIDKLED